MAKNLQAKGKVTCMNKERKASGAQEIFAGIYASGMPELMKTMKNNQEEQGYEQ